MSDLQAATPGQTIGPFYGYALPYERGHELVPPAHARATRLHGTVYDGHGMPIPDALVEIRQADESGTVPVAEGSLRRDGMVFTGWGR
jgi:protocatechuate 3,4-dioxygenase, alpha subunit